MCGHFGSNKEDGKMGDELVRGEDLLLLMRAPWHDLWGEEGQANTEGTNGDKAGKKTFSYTHISFFNKGKGVF